MGPLKYFFLASATMLPGFVVTSAVRRGGLLYYCFRGRLRAKILLNVLRPNSASAQDAVDNSVTLVGID